MTRPLAVDLFTGIGGWTSGLVAEGWRVVGYDIEDMYAVTGAEKPDHYELVLQNVLEINGAQFKDVDLIVSSSPCQAYSYMAMPWSIAKAKATTIRADETGQMMRDLNALFDAQFRIQREASEAAGRHIPMIVENVRGAQPWVGRAWANYGSFYFWGDVPVGLPFAPSGRAMKKTPDGTNHGTGSWFAVADSKDRGANGRKNPGFRFDGSGKSFQSESVGRHVDGVKNIGAGFKSDENGKRIQDVVSSKHGAARKAASAKIAKIPFALSSYIGRFYHPNNAADRGPIMPIERSLFD